MRFRQTRLAIKHLKCAAKADHRRPFGRICNNEGPIQLAAEQIAFATTIGAKWGLGEHPSKALIVFGSNVRQIHDGSTRDGVAPLGADRPPDWNVKGRPMGPVVSSFAAVFLSKRGAGAP